MIGRSKKKLFEVKKTTAPVELATSTNVVGLSLISKLPIQSISDRYAQLIDQVVKLNRLFLFVVIIPTIISIIYYGFIASNIYISESQFVVRSSKQQASLGGLGLIFGSSFTSASNENRSVSAFMLSRDALLKLNTDLKYEELVSKKDIDFFSRFGGFGFNRSFEDLYLYYQKYVDIYFDTNSAISTLKVSAFTPKAAIEINEKLLQVGELQINLLNERSRQDLIRYAKDGLSAAEKTATEATVALTNYRNKNNVFNAADYERLVVEKSFTLEQLKGRRAALEAAVTDAMKQSLYLERVVQPNKPDIAIEPKRLRKIVSTFVLGLVLWGVLGMLVAGVREHND